jgi:hypothetical protein
MEKLLNSTYEGERALFQGRDLEIDNCVFQNGESPLKESQNIIVKNSTFGWKYPLWYSKNVEVSNTTFEVMSRSGIWYTENITLNNCNIIAPKEFRRSKNITIVDSEFKDATETLWNCENVTLKNVVAKGDYLLMNSKGVNIDNLTLNGNYVLDGAKDIVVKNSILNAKDSFWNCENVVVENTKIVGEYIGWNSKNVTFINCEIESHQGFCYMENLKLVNCTLKNTDLAFEYSTVDAEINSKVDSIKNPTKGVIKCLGYDELILDDKDILFTKENVIVGE